MKEHGITENSKILNKYFTDINKTKLLSPEEEVILAKKIQDGDKIAMDKLIKSNLKFVIKVAKEYQGLGLPLSDLISEGNVGLIKAAKRFDESRGFKFISYAVHWIKQSIMQSLNENSRVIRLPANIINKIRKLNKDVNVDNEEVYPTTISLNSMVGDGENCELSDLIEGEGDNDLLELEIQTERLKNVINKTLNCLDERERGIIECYFGVNTDSEPMTLEDIGFRYDLTKERIRQIKQKAIRRLRYNNSELFSFMNS